MQEEALKKYLGKTIVVKYGGAAMQSDELKRYVMEDIVRLAEIGAHVILVHGGGPELSNLQKRLGAETKFVGGLRYTDSETIEAALMALCGKVNKELVRLIENAGGKAAGLSGIDGSILRCVKKTNPDLGFVGEITKVECELLKILSASGYIPVVSTVGLGEDGLAYNINADTASGAIAAAMRADRFITMSDIPGILQDTKSLESVISKVYVSDIKALIESGVVSGGMIPKVKGLEAAVRSGVGSASIIDGRVPHSLISALSGEGKKSNDPCASTGTTITI